MAESRKVVRVFLASPGDLKGERAAAKQVVDELNQTWFVFHGYQIELVGWELTVSGFGRPQALINQDLETCEYFLGLLYKRWGTPPDKVGKFTSGFEEEFRTSIERHRTSGKPEISLLFKTIDAADQQDPGEQLKRVLDFKKEVVDRKELLYEEFSTLADFQERVRRCMSRYVQRLIKEEETTSSSAEAQVAPEVRPVAQAVTDAQLPESILSSEGAQFLRNFITQTEQFDQENPPAAKDVARFRLLASVVTSPGTDKATIGVHDANILFKFRNDLNLSSRERGALAKAGLFHYGNENTPLWHWLASISDVTRLAFSSVISNSDEVKVGALSAMRDIAEPLPANFPMPREFYLDRWLSTDAAANLKTAALRYLSQCGVAEDLGAIRVELDRNDYQTSSTAVDAIIRINLRDSRQKAYAALLELQPESVEAVLLQDLFSSSGGIATDSLREGLGHRSSKVRLEVVRLLCARGDMNVETAEQLLADTSSEIRFEVMRFLASHGRVFSELEARKLLVQPAQGLGLLFGSSASFNEAQLDRFKDWLRRAAPVRELEKTLNSSLFNREDEFVLAERRFSKYGPNLRKAVGNLFKAEFDEAYARLESLAHTGEFLRETKDLEMFVREKHTRSGLDVICRRGDSNDLNLVRRVLASGFVGFSSEDVEYLRRFGEWTDVALIISTVDRPTTRNSDSRTILGGATELDGRKYRAAARAIYALAKDRIDELFATLMPDKLRAHLILQVPDKALSAIQDSLLLEFFDSKDDDVRKAAALRCAGALPRGRQSSLLDKYLDGHQYYNVIHWLDLGISMPRERVRAAIWRIIDRTWPA